MQPPYTARLPSVQLIPQSLGLHSEGLLYVAISTSHEAFVSPFEAMLLRTHLRSYSALGFYIRLLLAPCRIHLSSRLRAARSYYRGHCGMQRTVLRSFPSIPRNARRGLAKVNTCHLYFCSTSSPRRLKLLAHSNTGWHVHSF